MTNDEWSPAAIMNEELISYEFGMTNDEWSPAAIMNDELIS